LQEYALIVAQQSSSSEDLTLAMERVLKMYVSVANGAGQPQAPGKLTTADAMEQWIKLERANLMACIDYAVKHDYPDQVYALTSLIDSQLDVSIHVPLSVL
jgi:hypothetical protein